VLADKSGKDPVSKAVVHVEDALILVSVGLLFWLGVLHRREAWAQIAMVPVLGMMVVVFVHRLGRLRRVMRGR